MICVCCLCGSAVFFVSISIVCACAASQPIVCASFAVCCVRVFFVTRVWQKTGQYYSAHVIWLSALNRERSHLRRENAILLCVIVCYSLLFVIWVECMHLYCMISDHCICGAYTHMLYFFIHYSSMQSGVEEGVTWIGQPIEMTNDLVCGPSSRVSSEVFTRIHCIVWKYIHTQANMIALRRRVSSDDVFRKRRCCCCWCSVI